MRLRLVSLCLVVSCGAPQAIDDGGVPDAGRPDGGAARDAGVDAGLVDAGLADAGVADAGVADAGVADAGVADGGVVDAGVADAGAEDAGELPDAGPPPDAGPCRLASGVGDPFRLRAIAANLTSGNLQSWDPGHGLAILQAFGPDVVLLQELNFGTNDAAAMARFAEQLDGGWVFRGTGQIPNGVFSRWPIVDAGEWDDPRVSNRELTWALIDLPGPRDLWLVSVHLLTSNATDRNLEAQALSSRLAANVPERDFLLVGGDFNTADAAEDALSTLAPRAGNPLGLPHDQAGNTGTNGNRNKPYDHVLASMCLTRNQIPVRVGSGAFDAGLVFDTRAYQPLSDLPSLDGGESGAPNMQHMAVIKDFVIQP